MAGAKLTFKTIPDRIAPQPEEFIENPQLLAQWIYDVSKEFNKVLETDFTASNGVTLVGTDFRHSDTSDISNIETSGAGIISSLSFDGFGHTVGASTRVLSAVDIGAEPAFSKNTAFNKNFGITAGTVLEGDKAATFQPINDALTSISGLTTSADKMIYTTASNVYATTDLTVFARTLLDDANSTTARVTLGLGTVATFDGNQDLNTTDDVTFDVVEGTGIGDFSAAGIYLGGNSSANNNDDYEEGEFTVTFTAGTGTVTVSSTDDMSYTKNGRVVTVQGNIDIASVSAPSGTLTINGLPFTSSNTGTASSDRIGTVPYVSNLARAANVIQCEVRNNETDIRVAEFTGTTSSTAVADICQQFTLFKFSFSYITDL